MYASENGTPFDDRLVCWALVETKGDAEMGEVFAWGQQSMIGLVASGDGSIDAAIETHNFLGYATPGEELSCYDLAAKQHADRVSRERAN